MKNILFNSLMIVSLAGSIQCSTPSIEQNRVCLNSSEYATACDAISKSALTDLQKESAKGTLSLNKCSKTSVDQLNGLRPKHDERHDAIKKISKHDILKPLLKMQAEVADTHNYLELLLLGTQFTQVIIQSLNQTVENLTPKDEENLQNSLHALNDIVHNNLKAMSALKDFVGTQTSKTDGNPTLKKALENIEASLKDFIVKNPHTMAVLMKSPQFVEALMSKRQ